MINPEIRIKKSFLLNGKIIPLLKDELLVSGREQEGFDGFIDNKVIEYKTSWSKYEKRIVPALCEVLGVEFNQNIIDIYIAPFNNSFSDPMVISTKYSSDRVIDVITHEIAHRLLTDNNKLPMSDGRKLSEHWQNLFGEQDFIVLTHIPVHALLQHIFIDILDEPGRLTRDIEYCNDFKPYKDAWTYVQEKGYMTIIEQLKQSYGA